MDLPLPPSGNEILSIFTYFYRKFDRWVFKGYDHSLTTIYLLDTELRNIIDKLAQFVARNGPEFEQMTKTKQKGNPKFQFLYGGEYYNYYQYKVNAEQAGKRVLL